MSLNKVLLIGNLGSDPEMRYTPNGNAVSDFRMAVNRRYTPADGEPVDETVWFRVTAWGRLAEQVNQYLQKGSRAYVEGRISTPSAFMDREGQPRASLEITAERVLFLDPRGTAYDEGAPSYSDRDAAPASVGSSQDAAPEDVEELPW